MGVYRLGLRLGVYQLFAEVFPIAIFGCLLNDNLLVIIRQFVENVLDLLVELELVEFRHAVGGDGDSVFGFLSACSSKGISYASSCAAGSM